MFGPQKVQIGLWCWPKWGPYLLSNSHAKPLSLPGGHRQGEDQRYTQLGEQAEENLHKKADRGRTKASLGTRMQCIEQSGFCP